MKTRRLIVFALGALCLGCMDKQVRSQKEDDADRTIDMRTIGDLSVVSNAQPIQVIGVGLVTNLPGTGGGVPPGNERAQLENELKKLEVSNLNELFTSKTTSLVRVVAFIPPGAQKNDPVDILVMVPEYCRTSSLRGGKLEMCWLYSFENAQNLSTDPNRPDRLLRGHAMVKAEGQVLAGLPLGEDDDAPSPKVGKVWGGGKVLIADRPFVLELNPPSVKVAVGVAERINETFHGPGSTAAPIAVAKNDTHVVLNVPGPYRLNMGRFLRVVRLIPVTVVPGPDSDYVKKYVDLLKDPSACVSAALRLEALGPSSVPTLKVTMQNDDIMVRFAAAESLAYLGSPSCAEELARQVVDHPLVQAYALTASASLNEAVCRIKLQELLSADAPQVRYGAFRALRAFDDHDPLIQGERVGPTFWLHRLAPDSPPQVHASTGKRAEIVLFGTRPELKPPFSVLAGPEFMLTANDGDTTCTLSRFSVRQGKQSRQCSLELGEVLMTLGELGGTYPDALDLLRQIDAARAMNCSVKLDALPKAPSVQELAKTHRPGRGGDVGPGPSLYDTSDTTRAALAGGLK